MNDWMNNPAMKNIDPIKLELIKTAASKTSGKSGKELAPIMMALISGANKQGIRFTPEEMTLILDILKDGKSKEEREQIAQVCAAYKKVILVINTGGLMDLGFTEDYPGIVSIIQFVQAGQEGGNALADILSGAVTLREMTDTWALDYKDYPNADYFSSRAAMYTKKNIRKASM